MLARYRKGCLQKVVRKDGLEGWQFRWLQKEADGVSRERKKIGGVEHSSFRADVSQVNGRVATSICSAAKD
jgi:hypothetical protein